MRCEVFQYDPTAQRMTDEHRRGIQCGSNGAYVVHVVGDRARIERLGQSAGTVAAKAQCRGLVTPGGEEVQKILIPAPSRDARTVNEKQWYRVRIGGGSLIDHFEHRQPPGSSTPP